MLIQPSTYKQQSCLVEYIRTGNDIALSQLKGINRKGIHYYRELVFNILWDTINNAYPIMTNFLSEDKMKELTYDFLKNHKCQSYKVWEISKEFKDYFIKNKKQFIKKYPFIKDLLLLEWIEIEFFMMKDIESIPFNNTGNFLKDKIILNPEIHILSLNYPVHKKHPREISENDKDNYFLLLYRHPTTKKVIFTEINILTIKIIELLYYEPMNLDEILNLLIKRNIIIDKKQIESFIYQAYKNGIILGFSKNINRKKINENKKIFKSN